jgi:hypothetical protein
MKKCLMARRPLASLMRLVRRLCPESSPDAEWGEDETFNAGDAILANPLPKEVYKQAILKGWAFEKVKTK